MLALVLFLSLILSSLSPSGERGGISYDIPECNHRSLFDAYDKARYLPIKVLKWKDGNLEYLYEDDKTLVTGTLYRTPVSRMKDLDENKKYLVFYCSEHFTIYTIGEINDKSE